MPIITCRDAEHEVAICRLHNAKIALQMQKCRYSIGMLVYFISQCFWYSRGALTKQPTWRNAQLLRNNNIGMMRWNREDPHQFTWRLNEHANRQNAQQHQLKNAYIMTCIAMMCPKNRTTPTHKSRVVGRRNYCKQTSGLANCDSAVHEYYTC